MPLETLTFDAADYLDTPEAQAEFLADALEDGDAAAFKQALDTVARARGMAAVAEEVGITRQGLSKALSEGGNPTLATLLALVKTLGFRLTVEPAAAE